MAKTSFYLSKKIESKLRITPERRLSATISTVIDRYVSIMDHEKKKLLKYFTIEEWNTLYSVCTGTIFDSTSIRRSVLINLQDSMDYEIKDFGANKKYLEDKLQSLELVQDYALVELIEEWWDAQ